jgi:[acyl-carrier-protein] S-malonyltransferase
VTATAFVFPGQGSQRPGMGLPWRDGPAWELVSAGAALVDADLERLLLEAPAEELRGPFEAQVCTYLTSLLALAAVRASGHDAPVAVAGHSLGELTALVAAGALEPLAGLTVVAARGRAMAAAAAARPGVMSALLGADEVDVEAACERTPDAWPANYNAPRHVVVSGSAEAVPLAAERSGATRVLPIPVGGAYHTPFMDPAREPLATALRATPPGTARVAVWCNVDACAHLDGFAELLLTQLTAPVRWAATLLALEAEGVDTLVEIGPGTVLTGLARRTVPGVAARSVSGPDSV